MLKKKYYVFITTLSTCLSLGISDCTAALAAPKLKWQKGGCYSSWCETGWYSSPALVDINSDGVQDVVASAYSLFALNGKTGRLLWRAGDTSNRTWPGVVVADIDKKAGKEIVIAQHGGFLSVYNLKGILKWKKQVLGSELRGLLAADLDGNNSTLELVVTAARGNGVNTWVYDSSGKLRAGWPQLSSKNGYAWGVYNSNLAAGNLDPSDSKLELMIPSDVTYINGYKPDGSLMKVKKSAFPGKTYWGQVGVWENPAIEKRGWGACNGVRAESYRANFANGPALIADVDGDGKREMVAVGNMYDCKAGYPPSHYMSLYIFNKDRTRFNKPGYDWRTIPINTGAPIAEDYNKIETAEPNPVAADLDGDGKKEILYASYDGRLHAVWLDKRKHGNWPYSVYKPNEGVIRFASEPAVVDLNADGKAEVIFTSWVQKGSNRTGKLHIVNAAGQRLHEVNLPLGVGTNWNGALAAPTVGNIDADADLEVVVNSAHSGVLAYDLPGTSKARILWGTGRGSYLRNAAL